MSAEFYELFKAAEAAAVTLGASSDPAAINKAYSILLVTRETLTKYVEQIEKRAGVIRDVKLRF